MNMILLLRRCHLPMMLLLGVFSPLLLLLSLEAPSCAVQLTLFPAAYALLTALLIFVPGRMRTLLLLAGSALGTGAGFLLFANHPLLLFMPVLGAAAVFFALSYADRLPAEISPFFYVVTLIAQLATLFMLHHTPEIKTLCPALAPLLQSGFALYLLLLLLSFSRISLNNATLSRYRLPGVISRVSTALTVCFFALSLALSCLPAVIAGIYAAFHLLQSGMKRILLFLLALFPAESTDGYGGAPLPDTTLMSGFIEHDQGFLSMLLERAAEILTLIVIVIGTLLLVQLIARLLVRLARHIFKSLQRYAAAVTEDYEDEITDTRREDADRSLNLLRPRLQRQRTVYPDTPAGEIRRSYARLLRAHSEWTSGSTARENLPRSAAALYERARYSEHPVTRQDAGRFAEETRKL